MTPFSSQRFKLKAQELGFNVAGVIPAQPVRTMDAYFDWVEQGLHGEMGYLARPDRQVRRRDLSVILPGVHSMLVVGLDYGQSADEDILSDPSRGRIAKYAWGLDYHDVMVERLEQLADWLVAEAGQLSHRVYVDTGAILERGHGNEAGLGFIGKNTMLIHPRRGSDFFLGEILMTMEFDTYDSIAHPPTMCGTCTRCLSACPTDAFPKPFLLDSRRCISYLTIEYKGYIVHELRPLMGNWVYGCDVCQDVCPWQRFTVETTEAAFKVDDLNRIASKITDLLVLDDETFRANYKGSPIYRIKRERLVRNACIAAGNWGDPSVIWLLQRLLDDTSPLVRSHAAWGLAQVVGQNARNALQACIEREPDISARQDMQITLDHLV